MRKQILLIATALLSVVCCNAASKTLVTKISGRFVGDAKVNEVTLLKEGSHPSVCPRITIPVKDGKFSHTIESDYQEAYYIVPGSEINSLDDNWIFFTEGGNLDCVITPVKDGYNYTMKTKMPETLKFHEFKKSIREDPENKAYKAFCDSIIDNSLYHIPELEAIYKRFDECNDDTLRTRLGAQIESIINTGNYLSEDGKKVEEWGRQMSKKWKQAELESVRKNRSLVGLYKIVRKMWKPNENNESFIALYEQFYKDKFKGHPYSQEIEKAIPVYRHEISEIGCKYTDVEALDADGKMQSVSTYIDGKVAIIDLWASWCGPCRRNSKAMIPLYEKFHPKGLAIIGLAREIDNDKKMRKAVAKDGYPWSSLVEINDKNRIWTIYGVPNAPGRVILVDKDGIILAIDPTIEELEQKLAELLP